MAAASNLTPFGLGMTGGDLIGLAYKSSAEAFGGGSGGFVSLAASERSGGGGFFAEVRRGATLGFGFTLGEPVGGVAGSAGLGFGAGVGLSTADDTGLRGFGMGAGGGGGASCESAVGDEPCARDNGMTKKEIKKKWPIQRRFQVRGMNHVEERRCYAKQNDGK